MALSEQQARSDAEMLRKEVEHLRRITADLQERLGGLAPLAQDRAMERAVADAEVAVADMHGRLLGAMDAKRKLEAEVSDLQHALDFEKERAELRVKAAREDGSARIQGLEEAVRVLGGRSDLHREARPSRFRTLPFRSLVPTCRTVLLVMMMVPAIGNRLL